MNLARILSLLLIFAIASSARPWFGKHEPAPISAKSAPGRFAVEPGGAIILDRISGLHWQRGVSMFGMTLVPALIWCTPAGQGQPGPELDWRLPTRRELEDLVDSQTDSDGLFENPAVNMTAPVTLWTSSPANPPAFDFHFLISFVDGGANGMCWDGDAYYNWVRCVR